MEGWRLPGAPRHGIGFGASGAENSFVAGPRGLQPDDTWFGDPLGPTSLPSQFATQKRSAPPDGAPIPSKTARRAGSDPTGRLLFDEPYSSLSPPSSSRAMPSATRQVPSAALQAGRLSLDAYMPVPPGPEETFAAEVWRITGMGNADYRCVLGLEPSEWGDLQAVQSRYRRLMRLLHPDKRREDEQTRAGGKERCDLAVRLVQEAMGKARDQAKPDPQKDVKESMRRNQELQRRQSRTAMQRQAPKANEAVDLDAESLLSEISDALGEGGPVRGATTPPPSDTTSELLGLLASMRQTQ